MTAGNCNRFTNSHNLQFIRAHKVLWFVTIFTSRCFVATCNRGRSLPLGFRTIPCLSYQLFTATACNNWIPEITPLTHQSTLRWLTLLTNSVHINPLKVKIKVKITLRLVVHLQSVRLGAKPLETHDQSFLFLQLNPCDHSPYVTSSLTKGWICLLWVCLIFFQVYVSHI
jgi:hypothetical protein